MPRSRPLAAALLPVLLLTVTGCDEIKRAYNKGRVVATAQDNIYSLSKAGVTGFGCNVDVDWPGFFVSVNGKPLPPESATMKYLEASHLSFSADLANDSHATWALPSEASLAEEKRANIKQITDSVKKMVEGFLEAWVPTLNGRLLPSANTSLETKADGYQLNNMNGQQINRITLDRELRITHIETTEPQLHSSLDSTFTGPANALLMTSLGGQTQTSGTTSPVDIQMKATYAQVSGVELPETLFITVPGMGMHMKFVGCKVKK